MGKRCKIAGGADRALFRDDRNDAARHHRFDQPHNVEPDAGGTTAERNELQRHDETHDIFRQRLADAAAMGKDEIALECGDIGAVDLDRGKFAEAGIDAVNRRIAGSDLGNAFRRLEDPRIKRRIEFCRNAGPVDGGKILK